MARFNPATYDPALDSSKGTQKHRNDRPGTVVLLVEEGYCPDGCGQKPNGKGRTFRQGHDARLKGILIRAGATDTGIVTITKGKAKVETAAEMAKRFGFSAQVAAGIKQAAARAQVRAAKNKARADKKAAPKPKKDKAPAKGNQLIGQVFSIKVGRWDKEGEVVSVKGKTATLQYDTKDGTKETTVPVADLKA